MQLSLPLHANQVSSNSRRSRALLTARRYPGSEALSAGIAHELANEDSVVACAMERALELAQEDRKTIREHKRLMRQPAP